MQIVCLINSLQNYVKKAKDFILKVDDIIEERNLSDKFNTK